jgi:hypothetical protein
MKLEEAKWKLVSEGCISLVGTQICIVHASGVYPFRVHRNSLCYSACEKLSEAKRTAMLVVHKLMEMGIDP